MLLSAVRGVRIDVGVQPGQEGKGYYRLVLSSSPGETLTINMKPFGKADLAAVLHELRTHAPDATMDTLSSELLQGNLKPVVIAGLRRIWQVLLLVTLVSLAVALVGAWLR